MAQLWTEITATLKPWVDGVERRLVIAIAVASFVIPSFILERIVLAFATFIAKRGYEYRVR